MTERATRVVLKYHPYIWNASVYSAVRFSMTADVKNEHRGESLHLNILYCVYCQLTHSLYSQNRSDQVKQTHLLHIDVTSVHRPL